MPLISGVVQGLARPVVVTHGVHPELAAEVEAHRHHEEVVHADPSINVERFASQKLSDK